MNRLHSISFNEELVESLRNEDLLNELFLYYERLKKCNRTINDINHNYELVVDRFTSQKMTPENYSENFQKYVNNLQALSRFVDSFKEKTIILLAILTLLLKKKRCLFWKRKPFSYKKHYININNFQRLVGAITVEIKKSHKELEQKSREEIAEILGQ